MTIPKATSLASSIREGAGNHESAIPKQHSPTKSPAIGVRNPEARATPLATKVVPRNHVLEKALDDPRRLRTPSVVAVRPTATRNSNRPRPGPPPGNVEYSLCSAYLPGAPSQTHNDSRYKSL